MKDVLLGGIYQEYAGERFVRVLSLWPDDADSQDVQRVPDAPYQAKRGFATIVTWNILENVPAGRPTFAKMSRFNGKSGGYKFIKGI